MKRSYKFQTSDIIILLFSVLSFGYVLSVLYFYPSSTESLSKNGNSQLNEYGIELSPSDSLDTLREQILSNPGLMVNCHSEAHKIGRGAYDSLHEKAFEFAVPMCGGGYLHGVLEEAFLVNGLPYLDDVVHKQCNGEILESCLHGVGHGIHELTKDLISSVEICATIYGSSTDCYDGVYMDIFDTEGDLNIEPLDLNVAMQMCESSPEEASQSCYFYLPRVLSKHEPEAIIELCSYNLVKKGWAACANGSGVYFMKHTSNFDREIAESFCTKYSDPNLYTLCLRGVNDYEKYGAVENTLWH